jgi:hypothetical protein
MKAYRVLIDVQNVQTELDGVFEHCGFYTTRFVIAADQNQVTSSAINLIKNEDNFKAIQLNTDDDPPRFLVEEIEEINIAEVPQNQIKGYTLYVEDHTKQ